MVLKSRENVAGAWAFLIGVILAILIGISTSLFDFGFIESFKGQFYAILILIGLFVGVVNVGGKDSQTFLIAGVSLVIVSGFGMESVTGSFIGLGIGELVRSIFGALLALFVPATIVVAIKSVFSIARV